MWMFLKARLGGRDKNQTHDLRVGQVLIMEILSWLKVIIWHPLGHGLFCVAGGVF